jgi:hypothetical protein
MLFKEIIAVYSEASQDTHKYIPCLLVVMGETSSQHYNLWLIVLSPDESECDRVSERDQLGLTPNLTTRDLWRSMRWARKW